ncbi:MAG: hypothetical protein WCK36_02515 [Candidatus Firestonebacteria bacterium]
MRKTILLCFSAVLFISLAACSNNEKEKILLPQKTKALTSPEAEKVSGFKYLLEKYNYGRAGKYSAGEYKPFEKLPNIREDKGFYILDLYPDSRAHELLGYVVELVDANRKVLDFRFYPGKPEFLAVKKEPGLYKFILYSVKLNGDYFERGVYLSQSYWEHVVIKDALKKGSEKFKPYSALELEASDTQSCVPLVRSDELVNNKQNYIWKLVALRRGSADPQFIKFDVRDPGIFTDDALSPKELQQRYNFYSPGWAPNWTKDAIVYGVLCEVPAEWFKKLFKDKSYLSSQKPPEVKKEIKDIQFDHYFQVIF